MYPIRVGIRGLLVPDEQGNALCYMVCEASSHIWIAAGGCRAGPDLL